MTEMNLVDPSKTGGGSEVDDKVGGRISCTVLNISQIQKVRLEKKQIHYDN